MFLRVAGRQLPPTVLCSGVTWGPTPVETTFWGLGAHSCVCTRALWGLTATARTVTVFLVTSHITVLALRSACLTHGEWHVLECDVAASGEETEPSQRMEMVASTRAELEAGPFG